MVYMATDTFKCRCGIIEKGKLLISSFGVLYYNGRNATDLGSENCDTYCRRVF
jgi:hypothetical protein